MENERRPVCLSAVIPAYNEEKRLGASLERIGAFLGDLGRSHEILVVDDGSRDGTASLVEKYAARIPNLKLLRNNRNRGKGYTVRRGILAAEGALIFFTDADLAVPIEELPRFIDACEHGADIAIGDRYMEESQIAHDQPLYRRIIGYIGGMYVRVVVLQKSSDTQCGFKCLRREAARALFGAMRVNGGMFDVELIFLAHRAGYRIRQIPVAWSHCPGSNINIVKCLFTDPVSVLGIRIRALLGRYTLAARRS